MAESQFTVDLAIVVAGGFVGAIVAHALRLPAVAGYLAAGVLLGPGVLGIIRDSEIIASMADLGVALLMFAIGME
ncbi:MAG: cation:proton antiporter, partial [Proteobacteria bacterium]|nr:cation:proton antiporter [Pseudomonadota bacterium]